MLTSTSPSPSTSARTTFQRNYHISPREIPRTSAHSNQTRPSASSTANSSYLSPRNSDSQSALVADSHVPKAATTESGTQYTPPDWPPTDPRSSLYVHKGDSEASTGVQVAPVAQAQEEPLQPEEIEVSTTEPTPAAVEERAPEPPKPITPHSSLGDASVRVHTGSDRRDAESTELASPKRARHMGLRSARKVLPADYVKCDPKALASLIAGLLMRVIHANDDIPLQDGQLTRFHSRAPPGISVHDYLARLTFHATLAPPILLSMVFFIDRLSEMYPTFILNSLTVHRYLITAATVASKGLSDSFWTNSTYARVGGVSVKELAVLELELLERCNWKIIPQPGRLIEYYFAMVQQSDDCILEGQAEHEEESRGRSKNVKDILPNAFTAASVAKLAASDSMDSTTDSTTDTNSRASHQTNGS